VIDRSTPALGDLFQDIILEHYKRPRNKGALEDATVKVHMNNPTCGDEVLLYLQVEDGVVRDVAFEGEGCSISQSSISMMTQILKDRPVEEGLRVAARFKEMMHGDAEAAKDRDLRDARALAGVSRFPTRVKCALLGWNAFEEAAERSGSGDAGSGDQT
jgi:nitrogen fixation NifU-like protein